MYPVSAPGGVPIALFVNKTTGELHPETARLIEEVALKVEQTGIDAWFDLDAAELLGDEADQYEKVLDTLDVWFDSGVTHYSVLDRTEGLEFPANMYLEGSDQHRGWFQSSLKTSIAIKGCAPYKQVLTHGFTVDGEGRKMSKSVGNVVSPQDVMNKYGADILRLWVAATDFSSEMTVSDEILKRTADAYRRIRNTARFLLANLEGFNPETDMVAVDDMVALDRWAVDRAARLQDELTGHYDQYPDVAGCIRKYPTSARWIWVVSIWISSRTVSTPRRRILWRVVLVRLRCTILSKRWCAGSLRSSASPLMRSGQNCRVIVRNLCSW